MSIVAYAGIDWHEASLRVYAVSEDSGEMVIDSTVLNDKASVTKVFKKWGKSYTLRCCYESGAGGYVLYRWLRDLGIECMVVAASLVPQRGGDQIKTDRRDAINLARNLRKGDLTPVHIPTEDEERARRLVRHRTMLVESIVKTKNQIQKLLLSAGIKKPFPSSWTSQHETWLEGLKLPGVDGEIFASHLAMLKFQRSQMKSMEDQLEIIAASDTYRDRVSRLMCLKGIRLVSAMVLITEIIDFNRFKSPRQLMAYLGLVPTESSSGKRRRQGSITKAGNRRCRHILVESSWSYRNKPKISDDLKKRQKGQSDEVIAHSWKAQKRLYKKYWGITNRSKATGVAAVAVARELVGFLWGLMTGNFARVDNEDSAEVTAKPAAGQAKKLETALEVEKALKLIQESDPRLIERLQSKLVDASRYASGLPATGCSPTAGLGAGG
jgi:transposase